MPSLCAKRGWELAPILETLEALLTGIQVIENASLAEVEDNAKRRIAARDPDDWPVIALAISIKAPVWTEDTDFFGVGVETWTTRNVEIYFSEQ